MTEVLEILLGFAQLAGLGYVAWRLHHLHAPAAPPIDPRAQIRAGLSALIRERVGQPGSGRDLLRARLVEIAKRRLASKGAS